MGWSIAMHSWLAPPRLARRLLPSLSAVVGAGSRSITNNRRLLRPLLWVSGTARAFVQCKSLNPSR